MMKNMNDNFSIEDSVNKLWDKLDGWMDALILKLPNFIMAIIVMFLFYFIARGIRKLANRYLLTHISQKSI